MGKETQTQENVTYKRAKGSTLSQQVTTRPYSRDTMADKHERTHNKKDQQKKHRYRLGTVSKKLTCLTAPTSPLFRMWIKAHSCLVRMKKSLLIDVSSSSTFESRYRKKIKQKSGHDSAFI